MGWKCAPQVMGLVRGEPKEGQKHRDQHRQGLFPRTQQTRQPTAKQEIEGKVRKLTQQTVELAQRVFLHQPWHLFRQKLCQRPAYSI